MSVKTLQSIIIIIIILFSCHVTSTALCLLLAADYVCWATFSVSYYVIDSISLFTLDTVLSHNYRILPSFYRSQLITAVFTPVIKVIFWFSKLAVDNSKNSTQAKN